ncbi:MAG: response regulator transcription factor [Phycisphaeraceae bacterium]|nr:MAG: response regulator transcription factor [Phycisphaeraceae bacterium]
MRVLIVEDTRRLRESLVDGLTAAGYAVDAVGDGREGLIHARTTEYDLVVLDIMLPELDGISLLGRLRAAGNTTPVLVLSARDRVEQRVEGLRAGADDYLVKPFSFDELLARIEALTRRARGSASNVVGVGGVTLDLAARRFSVGDSPLELSPREYAVLEYLMMNAGRTLSRGEIEEHVYAEDRQVWSNAIDSAVAALRKKLAERGVHDLIETRRGLGYLVGKAGTPGADA